MKSTEESNVRNPENLDFDNFDEGNIESLTQGEIPAQTYRMIEKSNGSKVKPASIEAMKKSAKKLLE